MLLYRYRRAIIAVMKNPHAQALGRLGGLAKAAAMSERERKESLEKARRAKALKAFRRKIGVALDESFAGDETPERDS